MTCEMSRHTSNIVWHGRAILWPLSEPRKSSVDIPCGRAHALEKLSDSCATTRNRMMYWILRNLWSQFLTTRSSPSLNLPHPRLWSIYRDFKKSTQLILLQTRWKWNFTENEWFRTWSLSWTKLKILQLPIVNHSAQLKMIFVFCSHHI